MAADKITGCRETSMRCAAGLPASLSSSDKRFLLVSEPQPGQSNMSRLLSIDDDRSVHVLVSRAVENSDVEVITSLTAKEAIESLGESKPDAVLLDIVLPDMSGMEAYQRIREYDHHLPVIFITGSGTSDTAIEAMKLGAFDYVHKPIDLDQLDLIVRRALASRRLATVPVGMRDILAPDEKEDAFVGRCSAMQEVFKAVGRVAPQNVPVLV